MWRRGALFPVERRKEIRRREVKGPPQWGLRRWGGPHSRRCRATGLCPLAPLRFRAGRAQFPVVGPGGGSGSPDGLERSRWDSVGESILAGG